MLTLGLLFDSYTMALGKSQQHVLDDCLPSSVAKLVQHEASDCSIFS